MHCKKKPSAECARVVSTKELNETEVKIRKIKKIQITQRNLHEPHNNEHDLPEIALISHQTIFEEYGGTIEVPEASGLEDAKLPLRIPPIDSSADMLTLHEKTRAISEERKNLKNEHKDLQIQSSIHNVNISPAEIRRDNIIEDISQDESLGDIDALKTKYKNKYNVRLLIRYTSTFYTIVVAKKYGWMRITIFICKS